MKNAGRTPAKILAQMQLLHLGKILFNLQFVAVAIMLASVASFIITGLYYLVLAIISLGTVFLIYAAYPEFGEYWEAGAELEKITAVLAGSWKYTVPVVLALSLASIVCLCFDKKEKHIARISVSAVIAVLAIGYLFFSLVNSGAIV